MLSTIRKIIENMYSRPFLLKKDRLRILVDTASIDKSLSSSNRRIEALLRYDRSHYLELTRTPENAMNKYLQQIVRFQKKYEAEGSLHSIEIVREESRSSCYFGYKKEQIDEIGKLIYHKATLDVEEQNAIELVFVHAALRGYEGLDVLVTNNETLLTNRLWFESHFPGGTLNIMTMQEAIEVTDLFLKFRGEYSASCNYHLNKGYWYWLSFRLKVPFYNVGDHILDALAQRFVFLLMSVDEIGFQYFSGVNNDTMDNAVYHFNYFILLVSGIFDSLAIHTFRQYKLIFKNSDNPARISLCNDTGKDFLKAVREKNQTLRDHIQDYVHFVKAIYLLRDTVLHREGLQEASFDNRGKDEHWQANFIKVPNELVYCLKECEDEDGDYEPWTKFGVYRFNDIVYLEPYKFVKASALLLSSFCNKYLRISGFSNFIEQRKTTAPEDDFTKTASIFEKDNLGLSAHL